MTIQSGFFQSKLVDGVPDRPYSASEYGKRWGTFFTRGIIVAGGGELSTENEVSIVPASFTTQIAIGKGWIVNDDEVGYDYNVVSPVGVTHSIADPTNPRIDRIVLELNLEDETREIVAKVVEGTPAASPVAPALTRTALIYQISLAQILIPAAALNLDGATLTDERIDDVLCGIANINIGFVPPVPPAADSAENISIDDVNQVFASDRVEGALRELGTSLPGASPSSTVLTYSAGLLTQVDDSAGGVLYKRTVLSYTSGILTSVNVKLYDGDGVTVLNEYDDTLNYTAETLTSVVRTVI